MSASPTPTAKGRSTSSACARKARANALKIDWDAFTPNKPSFHRQRRGFAPYRCRELVPYIRLDALLPDLGVKGRYPRYWKIRRGPAAKPCSTIRKPCEAIVEERWFSPPGDRFWPANAIATTSALCRESRESGWRHSIPCVSNSRAVTARPMSRSRFVAPKDSARRLHRRLRLYRRAEEEKISRAMRANDDTVRSW